MLPSFVSKVLEITFAEIHIRGYFKRNDDRTCLFIILREPAFSPGKTRWITRILVILAASKIAPQSMTFRQP